MASFLDYLPRAQTLTGLSPEAEGLLEELLGQLLLTEGPPAYPMEGISEGYRTEIVRSNKGRPVCVGHTWTTLMWTCLLLETPSVPMERPVPIPKKEGVTGPIRFTLDSKSNTFQNRFLWACSTFGLRDAAVPLGDLVTIAGTHRTFLAWRPLEEGESFNGLLRFDVDNFLKNVQDGAQRAGIFLNDKGVRRAIASKDIPKGWDTPPDDLETALRNEAKARHGRGDAFETIMVDMRLAKAHMARIFPDYKPPRGTVLRTRHNPVEAHNAAQAALKLYQEGIPYQQARRQARASAALLRPLMAQELHANVSHALKTSSPMEIAANLNLDVRTLRGFFKGTDLEPRLQGQDAPKTQKSKKRTMRSLDRAVQAVLHNNLSIPDAATKHRVNAQSLRSKLNRIKKAKAPKKTPKAAPVANPTKKAPIARTKAKATKTKKARTSRKKRHPNPDLG